MSKQHHPATIFFLVVAIIAAAILGWRASTFKKRFEASALEIAELEQRLEAETNKRIGVERERDSLQEALSGNRAALHEFIQQVHVIHNVDLDLVVEGTATAEEFAEKVPVVSVELLAADGRQWRFMSNLEQMPSIEKTEGNTVRLTFRCHPVRTADIEGRPIAELGGVTRLRTSYQAVVSDLGVTVSPESTRQLVFRVDGIEAVNTVPAPPIAPDVWEYDVSSAFVGLYGRYQDQLRNRINAAASEGAAE